MTQYLSCDVEVVVDAHDADTIDSKVVAVVSVTIAPGYDTLHLAPKWLTIVNLRSSRKLLYFACELAQKLQSVAWFLGVSIVSRSKFSA